MAEPAGPSREGQVGGCERAAGALTSDGTGTVCTGVGARAAANIDCQAARAAVNFDGLAARAAGNIDG